MSISEASSATAADNLIPADTAAELRQQHKLFEITLASIGDGVITADADGKVTMMNPVAEQLTGWTNADARGLPLTEVFQIVNEDTRVKVENPALRAIKEGVILGLA